jgi:hypothetical protein
MDRRARGIVFYIAFALYTFYNVVWIAGLTFALGSRETVAAYFIGSCFVGDLIPVLIIPYRLRIGVGLLGIVLACSLSLCFRAHMMDRFAVTYWFLPKVLIVALAIWMERGRKVDYLA